MRCRGRGWGWLAVAGVVCLAGCTGSGSVARERDATSRAVETIARHFADTDDAGAVHFSEQESRCTARQVVDSLGLQRLAEVGLDAEAGTPPDLTEPPLREREGDVVYAAIVSCVDMEAQTTDFLEGSGAPRAVARCVARRYLATDLPRRALLAEGSDPDLNEQIDRALTNASSACATSAAGV